MFRSTRFDEKRFNSNMHLCGRVFGHGHFDNLHGRHLVGVVRMYNRELRHPFADRLLFYDVCNDVRSHF